MVCQVTGTTPRCQWNPADAHPVSLEEQLHAVPKSSWALSEAEMVKYAQLFRCLDVKREGVISKTLAAALFGQSGLEESDLVKIWCVLNQHRQCFS